MRARLMETRVDAADSARIDAFIRAWKGPSKRSESEAVRALLRLGLEAAAQPRLFDERWLDIEERLARIEQLLDALGRCVAANPALTAWLLGQVGHDRGEAARERLAESIELLIQADWDERCRARGIPRPRHVPRRRRQPVGQPASTRANKVYRMMLRLPESFRERVQAFAVHQLPALTGSGQQADGSQPIYTAWIALSIAAQFIRNIARKDRSFCSRPFKPVLQIRRHLFRL